MVPPDEVRQGIRGNRPRLRGDAVLKPRTAAPPSAPSPVPAANRQAVAVAPGKKRVLFVCIGNSCRSQMAEGFARAYGSDVMTVQSAGLSPATIIAPLTKQVLAERNIAIDDHFPKGLEMAMRQPFDLVVNMSGHPVSLPKSKVITWAVKDPIGQSEAVYRTISQEIEQLVMSLILTLRSGRMP